MFFIATSSSSTWRSRLLCECHLWLIVLVLPPFDQILYFPPKLSSCLPFLIDFSKLYVPAD